MTSITSCVLDVFHMCCRVEAIEWLRKETIVISIIILNV